MMWISWLCCMIHMKIFIIVNASVMILQHLLESGQTLLGPSADAEKLYLLAEEVLRYRCGGVGVKFIKMCE